MSTRQLLELWIPTVPWGARALIHGLTPQLEAAGSERWPARQARASMDAEVTVDVVDEPVGIEPRLDFIGGLARWTSETRCQLTLGGATATIERRGDQLIGHGLVRRSCPLRGVSVIFRALATMGLALRGVLLLHASAVQVGDVGLVLIGESGAGKTTTARRLGREGLRRLADDMIGIELTGWPPVLHPLPFGRYQPVALPSMPCVAGARVRGGAPVAGFGAIEDSVNCWRDALITLAPPPLNRVQERLLLLFSTLCQLPLQEFRVSPSGPISVVVSDRVKSLSRLEGNPAIQAGFSIPSASVPLDIGHPARQVDRIMSCGEFLSGKALSRAPNVAWRVIEGAAVLVTPASPTILTLNEVGTMVWELADGRPAAEILNAIVNEFEVASSQAQGDVETFVRDMEAKGLLVTGTSGPG